MANPRRLFILHVSPWSERARWMLDHHGLAYEPVDHLPFVRERQLRRLIGPGPERVTVPILVENGSAYSESWEIALYAERSGTGAKLVPSELAAEIRQWSQVADGALGAGRQRIFIKMLENPGALDASAPPFVPHWLRPILRPAARWTIRRLQRKYQSRDGEGGASNLALRAALDRLREGLTPGKSYLLDTFTYADIVMATMLQGVQPVADRFLKLPPALRQVWTEPDVAREYADLIAWRDRIYERHRWANRPN